MKLEGFNGLLVALSQVSFVYLVSSAAYTSCLHLYVCLMCLGERDKGVKKGFIFLSKGLSESWAKCSNGFIKQ